MLSPEQIEDIKDKTYIGQPAIFDNLCYVYPLTVEEIIKIGKHNYNSMLGLLTLQENGVIEIIKNKAQENKQNIKIPKAEDIDVLLYLLESAKNNDTILLELQNAFSTFIKEEVLLLPKINSILIGNPQEKRLITKDNFRDFQTILLIQNGRRIPEPVPPNETPFQKKMRLNREKVAEAKRKKAEKEGKQESESESLSEFLEIAETFDIDYHNRTLYNLTKLVQRKRAREKWDQDIQMLCAGADSEKLKTKYWGESPEE